MNKYQEALDYIKHDLEHNDFIRYKNGNHVDKYHREVLRKLVDQGTPMKPKLTENNGYCACCGEAFGKHNISVNPTKWQAYCSVCGQRIDWSDDDDNSY